MPSINQIAAWQDSMQQGLETIYGNLATTMNTMGTIGPPEVEYMPEFIDSGEGGSGTSERLVDEFAVGKKQASVTYKTRADERRFYMGIRSLYQTGGVKLPGPPFKFTFSPWTAQPATNIGNSIIVVGLEGLTDAAVQMLGTVCESVKLESGEGGFVTMTKKYFGTTSTLTTASAAAGTWRGTVQPMHYTHTLQVAGAPNCKPMKSSIEVTNNLAKYYGTSQTPTDLALGGFSATGSYTIPYKGLGILHQGYALIRSPQKITYTYGTSGSNGGIVLEWDVVFEDAKITEENGLKLIEFPWRAAKNATASKIEVYSTVDLSLT